MIDNNSGFVIVGLLMGVYAFLTLAFAALNNTRQSVLREAAEDGSKAAERALFFLESYPNLPLIHQIVAVIMQFTIALVAVDQFTPYMIVEAGWSPVLAQGVVAGVTLMVMMIVSVVTPEAVGSTYANRLFLWVVPAIALVEMFLRPVTGLILFVSRLLSSLFASDAQVNMVTEEEIMTVIDAGSTDGAIGEEQKDMIYSVLQLDETHASELMVPRVDMVALEMNTPLEDARAVFIRSGHSRVPVYEESIDTIRGLLYAKDLLTYWHNGNRDKIKGIRDLMRPAYYVPETQLASELLKNLKKRRIHMAIVIDEYGGTAGIVTIEDLIEQIIGDIQDEYDQNEEEDYVQVDDNRYLVDASMDLDDFNELFDVDIPTEESDTVGGFVYSQVGHVPIVGEEIPYEDELLMRVESVSRRRIGKLLVTRLQSDDAPPAGNGDSERLKAVRPSPDQQTESDPDPH